MPIGKRRLKKSMRKFDDIKANVIKEFPGELGLTIKGKKVVEIPTRPGFVYVRLRSNLNEVIQAYNDKVANVYGLKVRVARDKVDKSRWYVIGRDTGVYQDWGSSAYLPDHHEKHEFNPDGAGEDIVWVYSKQFMPYLLYPSGSSALFYSHPYYDGSSWNYSGLQMLPDLSSYKPTGSNASIVFVYIDGNDNPTLLPGDNIGESSTGTADILLALPSMPSASTKPIAAIRLVSGTTDLSWDNIYDLRQFNGGGSGGGGDNDKVKVSSNDTIAGYLNGKLVAGSGISFTENNDGGNETLTISYTGTAGGEGISGLLIYDDNVFVATGTAISFDDNLDVSVTGTTVFVKAERDNTLFIYDDGTFIVTGTAINFGNNLDVSVTGTTAYIDVSGSVSLVEHAVGFGDSSNEITGDVDYFNYDAANKILIVGDDDVASTTLPGVWSAKDGGSARTGIISYGGIPILSGWAANGTKSSPTSMVSGTSSLWIAALGFADGVFQPTAAYIKAIATETWTAAARGMKWLFQVNKIGSTSLINALELTGNQATFGVPVKPLADTTTNIEALSGIDEGAIAYSNSNKEIGFNNGSGWDWLKSSNFALASKGVTNGDSHDHVGGDGAQIDHGGLAGLSDDDHSQYLKADGSRTLSGDLTFTGNLKSYKNSTAYDVYGIRLLTTMLTSTSWDGDAYSTTSKTKIDLSSVFGAPDGIKAIYVNVSIRDSGAASGDYSLQLAPDNGAYTGIYFYCFPANDRWVNYNAIVPCDANGDIYYKIEASGAGTFDVYLQIYGYFL